jgi:hypothetical protein
MKLNELKGFENKKKSIFLTKKKKKKKQMQTSVDSFIFLIKNKCFIFLVAHEYLKTEQHFALERLF